MTAISPQELEKQSFYSFLSQELGSDFEVYALAGDASARRYFRIVQGESSWVLMHWEAFESLIKYPFTNIAEHLRKHKVRVPKLKASSPADGLLLLEDLGDLTLERKFGESQNQELSLEFYQQAIDQLIKIHYPSSFDKDPNCIAFHIQFDTDKFLWELNYAKQHLLEGIHKISFNESEKKTLQSVFLDISSRLHQEEKFISHRDYHSRNLMIKLGKVCVIDFQDARLGPIQYDLVSLLKDSYVDLDPSLQNLLLEYYFEKRKDHVSTPISTAQFQEIFELQSIQRCFKACGSFASFYQTREDTRYLKYISGTLQKVMSSLEHFPQYKDFGKILIDRGIQDMDYLKL